MNKRIIALILCAVMTLGLFGCGAEKTPDAPVSEPPSAAAEAPAEFVAETDLTQKGYELKKVVVLSRHNIRSPLSGEGSLLERVTTRKWNEWSSDTSELTVRGGICENIMGAYFRGRYESAGLFEKNARPSDGEVRFYANAKQRTLATANNFAAGMFPVADVEIESHADYDTMDPVFKPALNFTSDEYAAAVEKQVNEEFIQNEAVRGEIAKGFELVESILDYKNSPAVKSGETGELSLDDFALTLEEGEEPAMSGSLKLGCQISDALVLRYYETEDDSEAAFGTALTDEQWQTVSSLKDIYVDVLFATPLLSVNVANPLLKEIKSDIEGDAKFTFLCGHDSNVASVLAALGVKAYDLPGTPESAPIGVKLCFETWEKDGESFLAVRMIYATPEQLRTRAIISPDAPPASFEPEFEGIEKNADGLFKQSDFLGNIQSALDEYDELYEQYAALDAAA